MVNYFKNGHVIDASLFGTEVKDILTVLLNPQKQLFRLFHQPCFRCGDLLKDYHFFEFFLFQM